jgi:hypothetical protein
MIFHPFRFSPERVFLSLPLRNRPQYDMLEFTHHTFPFKED